MTRIPCLLIAVSLFLVSHIGCASLELPGRGHSATADASRTAMRCLCLWQPVETVDPAGQPVRGFGGQVYFFTADSEVPVAVTGDVRVYVFDDVGTPEQQTRPKDVQNYDPLVWKSFETESQVGINYAMFVPYHQASKYETICSLRLRLVRPDGTQLFSDMATVKLTGELREDRSIRQLVSPREHEIRPDRSRELRVDMDSNFESNSQVATIGSIEEGELSLSDEYTARDHAAPRADTNDHGVSDQSADELARRQIQRFEAELARMHAAYEKDSARQQRPTRPSNDETLRFNQGLQDLLPAIREVSRENQKSQRRVTPAAHEVFSPEEPPRSEHAEAFGGRYQSAVRDHNFPRYESRTTDRQNSGSTIRSFSRPLRRASKSTPVPERFEEGHVQALQLARITDQ